MSEKECVKLILYGTKEPDLKFFRKLKTPFKLIAYCDNLDTGGNEYKGLPFINVNKLKSYDYDYIVILSKKEAESDVIFGKLIEAGAPFFKILRYDQFMACDTRNPIESYNKSKKKFDGMVFGMSHSQGAFVTKCFDKSFFKFSSASMDFYFQYSLIKKLIKENREGIEGAKYLVFELPYYYFNYDMSKSQNIAKIRLNYMNIFDDFHHYGCEAEQERIIKQYKLFEQMKLKNSFCNLVKKYVIRNENIFIRAWKFVFIIKNGGGYSIKRTFHAIK